MRFPTLEIAFSEGGFGWAIMLMDRLEWVMGHSRLGLQLVARPDLTPIEAMQRNFWFCTIDIPPTLALRDRLGVDHIMIESDFPHADSTWPDTQANARRGLAELHGRRGAQDHVGERVAVVPSPGAGVDAGAGGYVGVTFAVLAASATASRWRSTAPRVP